MANSFSPTSWILSLIWITLATSWKCLCSPMARPTAQPRSRATYSSRGIQLIALPKGGKPAALNAGILRSSGEILILTDVRQVLEPQSVRELVACLPTQPSASSVATCPPSKASIWKKPVLLSIGGTSARFGRTWENSDPRSVRRDLSMPSVAILPASCRRALFSTICISLSVHFFAAFV